MSNDNFEISLDTVKITYHLDNVEHTMTMNQTDKFFLLKKYISIYQKVDIENYEITHNRKRLYNSSDNKILKEFMDKYTNEIFLTIKINSTFLITIRKLLYSKD